MAKAKTKGARQGAARAKREPAPRASQSGKRREQILAAALEEFSARGFSTARLDDVARRAGVAKGTIYLYFRDKETLFQELVRAELSPVVAALEAAPLADLPMRVVAERLVELFVREIIATHRKNVIRLILTEGPRFPAVAEFYYREVVAHVIAVLRGLAQRAVERGELPNDSLVRFPQLLAAPGIVAIIWSGLFDRWAKLDAEAFMRAYLDLIFGKGRAV
ncbi:MAG: TetR/AcrR family transcriptional regulator [Xanthobacteraceae bacterium]